MIQELYLEEKFSISFLCEFAGIAKSAYYKWLNRMSFERDVQNQKNIKEMINSHNKVKGIYGYRRMKIKINCRFQKNFNHKRIYRLMKIIGLYSVIRKKKKRYQRSIPQHVAENVLNREITANKPNEKWVTDVTEQIYILINEESQFKCYSRSL